MIKYDKQKNIREQEGKRIEKEIADAQKFGGIEQRGFLEYQTNKKGKLFVR